MCFVSRASTAFLTILEIKLDQHHLLPIHQSAYCHCHSTETAIVHMHDAIINAIDHGHIGALILLDMSAAFDTVDHNVLRDILHHRAGVDGSVLKWLTDFTKDRSHLVHMGESASVARVNMFGVPQVSVLGPKQFILYTEDASDVFNSLGITHHFYADDMQGIIHGPPSDLRHITTSVHDCITIIKEWCASKRLQLNAAKTEIRRF